MAAGLALGMLGVPQSAFGMPPFRAVVTSTYAIKPGGTISKAVEACVFCHVAGQVPKRNPYGRDLEAALKQAGGQDLTPTIIKSVENKDSDGDGFTNAAEIAADTLPGDPNSKPAGKPMVAPLSAPAAAGPFALKTLLFPKHAQHPVLVHFPIALLVISLVFDLLGYLRKDRALMTAGYYNLIVAGITAPFAAATGLLAWIFAFDRATLQGILLYHLILGVLTLMLIWALWWVRARAHGRLEGAAGRLYIVLGILAFLVVTLTGHLGGTLVQGG
jgi:uncharacterized membrane protein